MDLSKLPTNRLIELIQTLCELGGCYICKTCHTANDKNDCCCKCGDENMEDIMDSYRTNIQDEACECRWCSQKTEFTGTKQCNRCWELSHRIETNIALAETMLNHFKSKEIKP